MEPPISFNTLNNSRIQSFLQELQTLLKPNGKLTFYACIAGRGAEGTSLLKSLSLKLPGRSVAGFITLGLAPGSGAGSSYAGNVRDVLRIAHPQREISGLPRTDWRSPTIKIALSGRIIKWPNPQEIWVLIGRYDPNYQQSIIDAANRDGRRDYLDYFESRVLDHHLLDMADLLRAQRSQEPQESTLPR